MTRVAWFHCFNGVAGDMALGALLDAGADVAVVRSTIAELGIDGWTLEPERTQRCGVGGTHARVRTADTAEHRAFADIRALLGPSPAHRRALEVFTALAEVEGAIHGVPADQVEFHEVGSIDAVVDVVGVCAALEALGIDEVRCSPISVGQGTFRAAHGVLPNPGPAVVALLARAGAPAVGVAVDMELTTPTGAALMTVLATGFGPLPAVTVERVGYGAGTRDLPDRPNLVQVVIGDLATAGTRTPGQPVQLLEVNVDDATGELLAHAVADLLAAGAHDAWITPIVMKKGRPAHTVHVLCDPARTGEFGRRLVATTGSLGLRGTVLDRWPQRRTDAVVAIDGEPVGVKVAGHRVKVEFDDAVRAARALDRPVRSVLGAAEAIALDARDHDSAHDHDHDHAGQGHDHPHPHPHPATPEEHPA